MLGIRQLQDDNANTSPLSMTGDHLETSTDRDLEDQYNVFQCILVAQGHYSRLSYQLSVSRVGCTDRAVM